jgi:adenine-specific DNA-methyltransferase
MRSLSTRLADWGYTVKTGPLVWNRNKSRLFDTPGSGCFPIIWAEAVGEKGSFRLTPEKRHHAAFYRATGLHDPNLVFTACLLLQRTTSKEQGRRLISASLPSEVIQQYGAVAVENHLNMVVPVGSSPAVPYDVLAAFFASQVADRVIRCINASVALSASEIEEMPLPPSDVIISIMHRNDPEASLSAIYGLVA